MSFDKILFLDIETVPQTYAYQDLDDKTKELFNAKNRFAQNEEKSFEMIYCNFHKYNYIYFLQYNPLLGKYLL